MTDKERYKKMRSEERFTLIMMTGELERAEPGMTVEDFLKTSINYKDFKKKNEKADRLFDKIMKREEKELIERYEKMAKERFGQEEDE